LPPRSKAMAAWKWQVVASPERAGARDLIYVERAKHAARAAASAALCAIAGDGRSVARKDGAAHSASESSVREGAELLLGRPPIATGIHATAMCAPLARISPGVSIGPYVVIGEDAAMLGQARKSARTP